MKFSKGLRGTIPAVSVMTSLALLSGCAAGGGGGRVQYGDATAVETVNEQWGSTDIQAVANRMVDSLVRHPVISSGDRPVVQVSTLRNKTTEHIDTKSVTDKIRTALIRSGMVRFSAVSDANPEMLENLDYQQNSGVVSGRSAKGVGKQVGADYLLYGEIDSIVKKAGRITDVYYRLTLNMVDVETGLIEWSDEKEIRKVAGKPLFGAGLPGGLPQASTQPEAGLLASASAPGAN
ncbi:MAG: penicillin-binding protein activator LpoB [Candidatus Binatia bacterium]